MVNPSVRPGEHLVTHSSALSELSAQLESQHLGSEGLSYKFHQQEVNYPLLYGGLLLLGALVEAKSRFIVVMKLLSAHLDLYLNLTFSEAQARGLYQKSA